jgi:hypothetical protein
MGSATRNTTWLNYKRFWRWYMTLWTACL